jgi:small subunit ribosomal protein S12
MLVKLKKHRFVKKYKKIKTYRRTVRLEKCPQKRGFCVKLYVQSTKKPNSALRKAAKLMLYTKKKTMAHIPGIGHNLQKYSNVLIRGGRTQDLPGFNYKIIRGKLDAKRLDWRMRGRSKYGTKKI